MTTRMRITSVGTRDRDNPYRQISYIQGFGWQLTQAQAIYGIETGRLAFYIRLGGHEVDVAVGSDRQGNKKLTVPADGARQDALFKLPACRTPWRWAFPLPDNAPHAALVGSGLEVALSRVSRKSMLSSPEVPATAPVASKQRRSARRRPKLQPSTASDKDAVLGQISGPLYVNGDTVLDQLTGTRCRIISVFPLVMGGAILDWFYGLDSMVIRSEAQLCDVRRDEAAGR